MKKYTLSSEITVSAYTIVEANSLQEAIEIGESREAVLGGINSGACENESWIVDDADGAPMNIHSNEEYK